LTAKKKLIEPFDTASYEGKTLCVCVPPCSRGSSALSGKKGKTSKSIVLKSLVQSSIILKQNGHQQGIEEPLKNTHKIVGAIH
jgi:hypothetical protein